MKLKEQVIKKSALSPTILIAGGAGFIGSHLAEKLLLQDARVIVLDNLRTGKDIYIDKLQQNPRFAAFDANINEGIPEKIQSVDYIIHLASVESYLFSKDQVNLDSLLTNALGTKNLLDLAKRSEAKFLLVSSIDVYEGLISPMSLDHYFGETPEEERRYSLSEAKRYAEALVWEYYKKNHTDVRIVRIPEIFGPRMNLNSTGTLGLFLKEVMENRDLTVFGEGVEKEYYIYISDAINGLVKALFNKNTEGQIFTLAPSEPYAILEMAYLIKSMADSTVQVTFKSLVNNNAFRTPRIPDRGNLKLLKWEPRVDLKNGLKKTMEWFGYDPNEHAFKPAKLIENNQVMSLVDVGKFKKEAETKPTPKPTIPRKVMTKKKPKFNFTKPSVKLPTVKLSTNAAVIGAVTLALFVFVVTPFIQTALYTTSGIKNLKQAAEYLPQMEAEQAKNKTNKAFQKFLKAEKALSRSKWAFLLTKKTANYKTYIGAVSSAKYFSKAAYDITKASVPFENLWETIKPNTALQFNAEQFSIATTNLEEAKNNFLRAQAAFKNTDTKFIPNKFQDEFAMYESVLNLAITNIDTATLLAAEIPNLLGAGDQERIYMVIFQNSNEIRPTGGFIGSYALINIVDGKIKEITIDDIYNPDGQLDVRNIVVEPPLILGELLNEDKHYIRNANWNPDFNKSAEDIKNLYFKVSGKNVDGVFAVDLAFAENILKVTGPIYLTAFGEEITAENLYERTQFHSEFNYQEGSNQKKAFLTILGSKLLEGIFALENEQIPGLMLQIGQALEEKHFLIHLSNSAFASALTEQGWDGGLIKTQDANGVALSDYLYVVNANVGGTKANFFVKNEMTYDVSSMTRDGVLRAKLALKYEHTGKDDSWPGGPYKNYVRALVQDGAKLTNATWEATGVDTQAIFEEVAIGFEGDYTTFEKLVELQPQETGILTFYYDLPLELNLTSANQSYALYWQKQPGTSGDIANFNFEPPFGMETSQNSNVSGVLKTDSVFYIDLK